MMDIEEGNCWQKALDGASRRKAFCFLCTAACLVVWLISSCTTHAVELVSVPDLRVTPPVGGGGDSYSAFVTPDGRYVLFGSTANNLVATSNGTAYSVPRPQKVNAFLRDRAQQTTVLASVDPTGSRSGDEDSIPTGVSTNGRYALFEGSADNLIVGAPGAPANTQIFMRDMLNGVTALVTVGTNSTCADGVSSDSVMTPDGRYVAFSSLAGNLVVNDTNSIGDVFVRDLQTGVTVLASVGAQPATSSLQFSYGKSKSDSPVMTPDGRYVAFFSTASGLVPNVSTVGDIYVRDLVGNVTFCVSSNAHRFFSSASICYDQKISDDGQVVTFQASKMTSPTNAIIFRHHLQTGLDDIISNAPAPLAYQDAQVLDMTPDGRFVIYLGVTNSANAVYIWDGQTGTNSLVSVTTNGLAPTSGICDSPKVDSTGRYVSFFSTIAGLVTNTISSGSQDLYWRDLQAGITKLVDAGTNGTSVSRTFLDDYSMSANGAYVVFDSPDADLVTNDSNQSWDVFLRNLTADSTELISAHASSLISQTAGMGGLNQSVNISADGRYAVFCSTSRGLVPDYTNLYYGIFGRDLANQTNFLISVDTNGLGNANGISWQPVISGDGQHVAFTSQANNLVAQDTNGATDVFIRNIQTGVTTLVSANANNNGSLGGASSSPAISFDGHYVLYFNSPSNIVLRDCILGTNYSLTTNGSCAAITQDGHYAAFFGKVNGLYGLYVWDSLAAQTIYTNVTTSVSKISISTNGQWLAYISGSSLGMTDRLANSNRTVSAGAFGSRAGLRFSGDGRFLVYATAAANAASDTNQTQDVYVYDWQNATNLLVSQSFYFPQAPMGNSDCPDISADGRFIVYESAAADIAPSDNNSFKDIFLYDQQAGMTTLLSASDSGQGTANSQSLAPLFTGNGQTVAFQSWASDLVQGDFNQGEDAFIVQIDSTNSISGSTNPPPVFAGELIYLPASGQGNPSLTWPVIPGAGYTVQFKDNLTDPAWQTVNGSIVIVGGQAAITDLAPNPTNRFYRIVAY